MAERSPLDDATDLLKATTGFYPHLRRNRTVQDPEAAKNIPVAQARGMVAGLLGLPADTINMIGAIRNAGRSDKPFSEIPYGSEHFLETLPLKDESPMGQAMGALGSFTPPVGTALKGAKAAGMGGLELINRGMFGEGPLRNFVPQHNFVVKPSGKGANWLDGKNGSVESSLGKMKMADWTTPEEMADMQRSIDTAKRIMADDPNAQRTVNQMENELSTAKRNNAVNSWIDSNLRNYVKNQMATPDDPVRKLAEEGILHMAPYGDQSVVSSRLMNKRLGLGQDPLGMGKSDEARFWERQADISVDAYPAGSYKHGSLDESLLADNPWLQKVPDETMIYTGKGLGGDLGFDHIIDILRQDVREGRIRPEQLNKVSMEQAVRRVHEYDQEMAKKMAQTQAKVTEGMPIHKEYPEGYKWIELTNPKSVPKDYALPEGMKLDTIDHPRYGLLHTVSDPKGITQIEATNSPEDALLRFYNRKGGEGYKALEDALKYEGDTMGHCVGGYCPDVSAGRSRIYSLRDVKGEPHVTVEVQPVEKHPIGYGMSGGKNFPNEFRYERGSITPEQNQQIYQRAKQLFNPESANDLSSHRMDVFQQAADEVLGKPADQIIQIKGKQNAAPKADYLPYVQDFVKGGNWTDVGDIKNTGLRPIESVPERARFESAGMKLPKYVTDADHEALINEYLKLTSHPPDMDFMHKAYGFPKPDVPPPEGMKRGGKVSISNNPDTMMLAVNNQKMAKGGKVVKFVEDVAPAAMEKLAMMFGNKLPLNMNAAEVENLAKRFPAPSVDRINMNYKDVTKRVPELTEAAQKLQAGELDRETYAKLVQAHKPVTPYDFVPKPATAEEARGALREDARDLYGIPSKTLEAGSPVGLRLDIPAYRDSGVWVPTIHEQDAGFGAGKKIGHESVASVLNPEFGMSEKAALSIASGKPKGTIATIKGDWNPTNEAEAVAKAKEYLKHPEWRQVGMDPERHSFFYDRETMAPVVNAEEVIQIGPLVLAKNPKYGKPEDFKYAKGGLAHMAGGGSEDDADLTKPFFGGAGTKKYAAAKKRAEEVEPITERYPKTSAAVMGLMGTPPDEMGFSVLNPEYKDIMEVADPAFYAGTALGVAPLMKAFKAPAMALGRAGEKYAERVVPQIMERGGVGADILGGLAQGTRSYAYLPHTEKNPNPLVGSRYKTQHVGNLTPKFDFDVQAEQGSSVMSNPWDLTSRGEKVLEVSDIPMSNQIITEGGHDFARDIANIKANIGGASGRQIAERMQDRVNDATFANLFDKGTGRVFTMPSTMDVKGSHFSTMPTDIVMDIFQQAGLKPKDVDRITDDLRSFVFETEKGKFKNAAPVGSPEFMLQLRQGGKGFSAGDLRKGLMDRMSKSEYQKMLGFNIEDVYGAIGDQSLKGLPKGFVGNTMIETSPFADIKPSTHQSYDSANAGKYAGSMPSMPLELMMPDLFRSLEINYLKNPKYQKLTPMQLRTMIVNTIEKRGNVISQPINQRVVDNVMRYKQGLAQGHFQPNDYEGIMKFMRSTGGYKDGGAVHKAEGGDITGDDLIIEERPL